MAQNNQLYKEIDRLNAELEKSRTWQAILFIMWSQVTEKMIVPENMLGQSHTIDSDLEFRIINMAVSQGYISNEEGEKRKRLILSRGENQYADTHLSGN